MGVVGEYAAHGQAYVACKACAAFRDMAVSARGGAGKGVRTACEEVGVGRRDGG